MTSNIRLVISAQARAQIEDIGQYTLKIWGSGQRGIYDQILDDAFHLIQQFPDIGHPAEGQPSNVREYHLRHHVIQYRREPERVVILRIVNPRRRRR
ncbi:MAG: type II toxin-antitoxin system RelE/ParE family toxin [Chloroflexia bacterium]|nr:type II toxin-antitoxin system RelE/ParE family toxin [Chloroflexia bacterium]